MNKGSEIEPFVGSFGSIFVDEAHKSKKDLRKYVLDVTTKDIRDRIEAPAAQHHEEAKAAKLLSALYHVGPSSELVHHRMKLAMKEVDDPSILSQVTKVISSSQLQDGSSILNSSPTIHPPEKLAASGMKGSTAILLNDYRRSGPYFVPPVCEQPYYEKLEASLGQGSQFFTTPKMWPADSMYPTSPIKDKLLKTEESFTGERRPKKSKSSQSQRIKSTTSESKSRFKGDRSCTSPLPSGNPCSRSSSPINMSPKPGKSLRTSQSQIKSSTAPTSISKRNDSVSLDGLVTGWPSVSTVPSTTRSVMSKSGQLSGLQEALVQCGHLKVIYDRAEARLDESVEKSLAKQRKVVGRHARWLHGENDIDSLLEASTTAKLSSLETTGSIVKSKKNKTLKTLSVDSRHGINVGERAGKMQSLAKSGSESVSMLSSRSVGAASTMSSTSINCHNAGGGYMNEISDYMGAVNMSALQRNPYRQARGRPSIINKIQTNAGDDPTIYRQGTRVEHRGNFTVCLNTGVMGVGGSHVPSREEITASLTTVCRKALLRYDMKIVETGGLLKALEDLKNEAPGIGSILELHREFVEASALNPDPWSLSRSQLSTIISERFPWYPTEALSRLMTAFDTSGNRIIRFIKLSLSLICGVHGAALETSGDHSGGLFKHSEDPIEMLIRMMHCMFEHLECGILRGHDMRRWRITLDMANKGANRGQGMKIKDVVEMFSCCACSIDDEDKMHRALRPVIQAIYDAAQSRAGTFESGRQGYVAAIDLHKHHELQSVKYIPFIPWEMIYTAMKEQPDALKEFTRQLTNFRSLVRNYTLVGSTRFDKAHEAGLNYGSKSTIQEFL